MECPKCGFSHPDQRTECFRCGVVFEKYRGDPVVLSGGEAAADAPGGPAPTPGGMDEPESGGGRMAVLRELIFTAPEGENPVNFGGRAVLFLALLAWGLYFIFSPLDDEAIGGFWHLVNLPFHEAGHIVFRPFGRWITSLGGSLGQLLMPLICLVVFLTRTRDAFAASVALWWFGQNFLDIAPYIADARAGVMPLLGGNTGQTSPYGFHDWEFILGEIGMSRYDQGIAMISHGIGTALMILAWAWGAWLLREQFRRLDWG